MRTTSRIAHIRLADSDAGGVVTSSDVRVGVSDIAVSWEWLGVFGGGARARPRNRRRRVADELQIALGVTAKASAPMGSRGEERSPVAARRDGPELSRLVLPGIRRAGTRGRRQAVQDDLEAPGSALRAFTGDEVPTPGHDVRKIWGVRRNERLDGRSERFVVAGLFLLEGRRDDRLARQGRLGRALPTTDQSPILCGVHVSTTASMFVTNKIVTNMFAPIAQRQRVWVYRSPIHQRDG
jgi:hypothetical protein